MAKRRRKFKLPPPKRNNGVIHWIVSMPEAHRKRKKAFYLCGRRIKRFCFTKHYENITCSPCRRKLGLI